MSSELIFYQFGRSQVERRDFDDFLKLYAPDKLPKGRRLRQMMNCLVFSLARWGDNLAEIYLLQEVRGFLGAFHEAWPYWLYFCNLEDDPLWAMTLSCLLELTALTVDRRPHAAATGDSIQLLRFVTHDLMPTNQMS